MATHSEAAGSGLGMGRRSWFSRSSERSEPVGRRERRPDADVPGAGADPVSSGTGPIPPSITPPPAMAPAPAAVATVPPSGDVLVADTAVVDLTAPASVSMPSAPAVPAAAQPLTTTAAVDLAPAAIATSVAVDDRPVIVADPPAAAPAITPVPAPTTPTGPPSEEPPARRGRPFATLSLALTIVAALLIGFVLNLVVLSQLQHNRDQDVLRSEFRSTLADAVAPVGQVGPDGNLLAPGAPIGIIEIPVLGVNEVVVEGTTSGVTEKGPGHRRDTVFPGQPGTSVIFGRQAAFGGPFGALRSLLPGDQITVTTGQGVQTFAVTNVRKAGDPQPVPLGTGESRMTLVTAYGTDYMPDGVLRVDAKLTSQVQPAPARVFSAAALAQAELPMQGDPSQLFILVLWCQLLLVVALAFTWAFLRWGKWQAWAVGVPVLLAVGIAVADNLALLLPNLL